MAELLEYFWLLSISHCVFLWLTFFSLGVRILKNINNSAIQVCKCQCIDKSELVPGRLLPYLISFMYHVLLASNQSDSNQTIFLIKTNYNQQQRIRQHELGRSCRTISRIRQQQKYRQISTYIRLEETLKNADVVHHHRMSN